MAEWCFFELDATFPSSGYKLFGVIQLIYCPVITAVNVLLIVSLYATKQSFRCPSNFLILCLTLSDGLTGAMLMPLAGYLNIFIDSKSFCATQTASYTLRIFLAGTSQCMTMLLAVDRYLHMNPNFHRSPPRLAKFFQPPRIYFLAFTCCFAVAGVSIRFYISTLSRRQSFFSFATFLSIFSTTILVLFMMIYIRGYLQVRRSVAENPIYTSREYSNSNERPEYLTRLFKTVLLLPIAILVSWFPNLILKILITVNHSRGEPVLSSSSYLKSFEGARRLYYQS